MKRAGFLSAEAGQLAPYNSSAEGAHQIARVALDLLALVIYRGRLDEVPASTYATIISAQHLKRAAGLLTVVEGDLRLEMLLLSSLNSLGVADRVDDGHSLHTDQLLEVDNAHLVAVGVLERADEESAVRV